MPHGAAPRRRRPPLARRLGPRASPKPHPPPRHAAHACGASWAEPRPPPKQPAPPGGLLDLAALSLLQAITLQQRCEASQLQSLSSLEKLQEAGVTISWRANVCSASELERAQAIVGDTAGIKCRLPCLRTPPRLPAWWLQGPRPLLRTPERSLSSLEARGGPRSPSQAAPKSRIFHVQPAGRGAAHRAARDAALALPLPAAAGRLVRALALRAERAALPAGADLR